MPDSDGGDNWDDGDRWVTYHQRVEREEKQRMLEQQNLANPNSRHEVLTTPGWEASVTVYPLKRGESFREIRTVMRKGGGRLIIQSQDDIDELRMFLNVAETLAKTGKKPKESFNRFSDIDVV